MIATRATHLLNARARRLDLGDRRRLGISRPRSRVVIIKEPKSPCHKLTTTRRIQLAVEALHMIVDRVRAPADLLGDLPDTLAEGQFLQHLLFACGEPTRRIGHVGANRKDGSLRKTRHDGAQLRDALLANGVIFRMTHADHRDQRAARRHAAELHDAGKHFAGRDTSPKSTETNASPIARLKKPVERTENTLFKV